MMNPTSVRMYTGLLEMALSGNHVPCGVGSASLVVVVVVNYGTSVTSAQADAVLQVLDMSVVRQSDPKTRQRPSRTGDLARDTEALLLGKACGTGAEEIVGRFRLPSVWAPSGFWCTPPYGLLTAAWRVSVAQLVTFPRHAQHGLDGAMSLFDEPPFSHGPTYLGLYGSSPSIVSRSTVSAVETWTDRHTSAAYCRETCAPARLSSERTGTSWSSPIASRSGNHLDRWLPKPASFTLNTDAVFWLCDCGRRLWRAHCISFHKPRLS
ncbi:hypothetical protein BS50DRAFT_14187 [Corynespora cassiicola Philippines]|uniref:Uncharacterized protein n=1 Tax=Corynespora cassiicola Philippines TaxID=1448308 RepID=A0A2T2P9N5_CORCC|nr:hypothetical protein BS50DRAFT_14187 [Corynespora cassiicola Philippines]